MTNELYAFKCNDCDFIYLEPYDPSDRFAKFPDCPDCGNRDIEMYDDELPDDLQKIASRYVEEHGMPDEQA